MMSPEFSLLSLAALAVAAYLLIRTPRTLFTEAAGETPDRRAEWGLIVVLGLAGVGAYAVCNGHTAFARFGFALAAMTFASVVYADLRHKVVPDLYSGALLAVAILSPWRLPWAELILGAVMCGGLLWALGFIWRTMKTADALGSGDIKLAAAVGALIGPQLGLVAIALSAALAAAVVLGLRFLRRHEPQADEPLLPFGAVLALVAMALLANGLF